jgi:hypothetical protein
MLTEGDRLEARAFPSGQIALAATLIVRFGHSADELAFLLVHAMAHILLEHRRRGYEAAVPSTRLAGSVDARLIVENLKSSLPLQLHLLPLRRAQEGEPDRLGGAAGRRNGFRWRCRRGTARADERGRRRCGADAPFAGRAKRCAASGGAPPPAGSVLRAADDVMRSADDSWRSSWPGRACSARRGRSRGASRKRPFSRLRPI